MAEKITRTSVLKNKFVLIKTVRLLCLKFSFWEPVFQKR